MIQQLYLLATTTVLKTTTTTTPTTTTHQLYYNHHHTPVVLQPPPHTSCNTTTITHQLYYSFSKQLMLQEPLMVFGAFFFLFFTAIVYVRLDFSIAKVGWVKVALVCCMLNAWNVGWVMVVMVVSGCLSFHSRIHPPIQFINSVLHPPYVIHPFFHTRMKQQRPNCVLEACCDRSASTNQHHQPIPTTNQHLQPIPTTNQQPPAFTTITPIITPFIYYHRPITVHHHQP